RRAPVQRDFREAAARRAGTQSRPRTVYDRRSGIGVVIEARAGLGQYGAPRFIGYGLRRPRSGKSAALVGLRPVRLICMRVFRIGAAVFTRTRTQAFRR